jgi:hypothetical protein
MPATRRNALASWLARRHSHTIDNGPRNFCSHPNVAIQEHHMNTSFTTPFASTLSSRLAALSIAVVMTFAMLASVNSLANHEAQLAAMAANAVAASSAKA